MKEKPMTIYKARTAVMSGMRECLKSLESRYSDAEAVVTAAAKGNRDVTERDLTDAARAMQEIRNAMGQIESCYRKAAKAFRALRKRNDYLQDQIQCLLMDYRKLLAVSRKTSRRSGDFWAGEAYAYEDIIRELEDILKK